MSEESEGIECPIEPISGFEPPFNYTPLSWNKLRDLSDKAKKFGILSPFTCTNCTEKGLPDPEFWFEDGYGFVPNPNLAAGGIVGACRKCFPEMHGMGVAIQRRERMARSVFVIFVIAIVATPILLAVLIWFA